MRIVGEGVRIMPSRAINDLLPELQILFHEFAILMHDKGIQFIVTCTYRSQEEQDALYAKGRTTQGPIVTWTRKSRHTERSAFDIAVMVDGKVSWKAEDYDEPGSIGTSVGLEWGGDFPHPDRPHFQLKT